MVAYDQQGKEDFGMFYNKDSHQKNTHCRIQDGQDQDLQEKKTHQELRWGGDKECKTNPKTKDFIEEAYKG